MSHPKIIVPNAPLPPIVIDFLIACHVTPDPEEKLRRQLWNSPAGRETLHFLRANGMIHPEKNTTTKLGREWLRRICSTPMPKERVIEAVDAYDL